MGISKAEFLGDPSDVYSGWTLYDYDVAIRGFQKRIEREDYMLMLSTSYIMGMWAGKGTKITPEKLLGIKNKTTEIDEKAFAMMTGKTQNEITHEKAKRIARAAKEKKQKELLDSFPIDGDKPIKF